MAKQKSILCYGDSNTWGFVANSIDFKTYYVERYPRNIRWPGLLQAHLGDDYYVIEEGLNSRTTNIDYKDFPGRNGKTYLLPCLYSHAPLDLVILALGGNDLKIEFNRTAADIADAVAELIDLIQATIYGADMRSPPQILLIHYCIPSNETYQDANGHFVFQGAINKAKQLGGHFSKLAQKKSCHFLDISAEIKLSAADGIHLDEAGHKKFASLVEQKIKEIFN